MSRASVVALAVLLLVPLAHAVAPDASCAPVADACPAWWSERLGAWYYPEGMHSVVVQSAEERDALEAALRRSLPAFDLATHWALVLIDPQAQGTTASVSVLSVTHDGATGKFHVLAHHQGALPEGIQDIEVESRPAVVAVVERMDARPIDLLLVSTPLVDLPDLGL